MPNSVTIEDVRTRLEDLLERVRGGEEWLIIDHQGRPWAKLTPTTSGAARGERWKAFGMLKGQIEQLPGFDEPLRPAASAQEPELVQWPDFLARLREQWPDGSSGQPLSEIVDEGRGPRP